MRKSDYVGITCLKSRKIHNVGAERFLHYLNATKAATVCLHPGKSDELVAYVNANWKDKPRENEELEQGY